eukprot:2042005-Alexandrium_andersonii.AAC.1
MVHILSPFDPVCPLCLLSEPAKARPRHAVQGANATSPPVRTLLMLPSIHAARSQCCATDPGPCSLQPPPYGSSRASHADVA